LKKSSKLLSALSLAAILTLSGCNSSDDADSESAVTEPTTINAAKKSEVLVAYANIATDNYADTLSAAKALRSALATFTTTPSEVTLQSAKDAWLNSRNSYLQAEIFRLSNGPIDAEEGWVADAYGALEGQLNAWPLDENMIDYTTDKQGEVTSGNIIDTAGEFTPDGGEVVDVTTITADVLSALNENGGDANVATGYHAIEFLLWGQDQDYNSFIDDTVTNGANVAGQRVLEDYTSNANADRRKAFLSAAAEKLVTDLELIASAWSKTTSKNCTTDTTGCYRAALLGELSGDDSSKNISVDAALAGIFKGMGTFIKSELANERVAVAVLTPSEEDEHSCFSDNTHVDIAEDYQGFKNILYATYKDKSYGTSMYSLLSDELQTSITALDTAINADVKAMTDAAVTTHFDYQIKEGSDTRSNIINAKNEMRDIGDEMPKIAKEFSIEIGDVTDPDETSI